MAICAILLAVPTGLSAASAGPAPPASAHPAAVSYNISLVYYHSSVDNFLLSYFETIPYPFNASHNYPLAVELHGLTGGTLPAWGGTGGYVFPTTAQAAVNAGFILIDLNTRTGSGWYINSNHTGSQEQDVLDAIAHERMHRHIGSIYLFGTSMGSIGTLTIGLDHPRLFKGLGIVASFTDYFEMFAYLNATIYRSLTDYMLLPTGGIYPNASASARAVFEHLSSLRFHPENASGLKLYITNGAQDVLASNNATLWGAYQQENSTVLTRTCQVTRVYAEPSSCTQPLAVLRALYPNQYHYRYVFEPNGPHSYYLLNATDLFNYWTGRAPDGFFWGTYPFPSPTPAPRPVVTVALRPAGCGAVTIQRLLRPIDTSIVLPAGNYSVKITRCANTTGLSIHSAGGVLYVPTTRSISVTGTGSLAVTFRSPRRSRRPTAY